MATSRHAPEVAILRWNRSTAGATAPICSRTLLPVDDEQDRPPVQRSTLPRPANAPHGRESARHLEATSRDAGDDEAVEGDEERDLSRRRAEEAALYMESRCDSGSGGGRRGRGGGGGWWLPAGRGCVRPAAPRWGSEMGNERRNPGLGSGFNRGTVWGRAGHGVTECSVAGVRGPIGSYYSAARCLGPVLHEPERPGAVWTFGPVELDWMKINGDDVLVEMGMGIITSVSA